MSNAVDAFRQISWLVFKWLFIVVTGAIAVAVVILVIVWGWNWYSHTRHVDKIKPLIFLDKCEDQKFPLLVIFQNESERTVQRVSFRLSARLKGRSTDIARYHSYTDDFIRKPKEAFGTCWAVPELTEKVSYKELEWKVVYVSYQFSD